MGDVRQAASQGSPPDVWRIDASGGVGSVMSQAVGSRGWQEASSPSHDALTLPATLTGQGQQGCRRRHCGRRIHCAAVLPQRDQWASAARTGHRPSRRRSLSHKILAADMAWCLVFVVPGVPVHGGVWCTVLIAVECVCVCFSVVAMLVLWCSLCVRVSCACFSCSSFTKNEAKKTCLAHVYNCNVYITGAPVTRQSLSNQVSRRVGGPDVRGTW